MSAVAKKQQSIKKLGTGCANDCTACGIEVKPTSMDIWQTLNAQAAEQHRRMMVEDEKEWPWTF